MSPINVDPLSWIYGIPFALACFSFYRLPCDHQVKRELQKVFEYDAQVWSRLFSAPIQYSSDKARRYLQITTLAAGSVLSLLSLASFVAFLVSK